jgi:hypothetical protein
VPDASPLLDIDDAVIEQLASTHRRLRAAALTTGEKIMSIATSRSADRTLGPTDVALRLAIVGLTLGTAYIHSTLGGLLFTLNATGYLVAAVAMVIPLAIATRFRWVVRLGLIGYAAATIVGWAIQGPYFTTAYIAKAIEVALIILLAIDFARMDGNPINVIKSEVAQLGARLGRRSATGSASA